MKKKMVKDKFEMIQVAIKKGKDIILKEEVT